MQQLNCHFIKYPLLQSFAALLRPIAFSQRANHETMNRLRFLFQMRLPRKTLHSIFILRNCNSCVSSFDPKKVSTKFPRDFAKNSVTLAITEKTSIWVNWQTNIEARSMKEKFIEIFFFRCFGGVTQMLRCVCIGLLRLMFTFRAAFSSHQSFFASDTQQ